MFKTQNFCHIASNNRNQVKVGVFVYRTTDSLATVSASGYFNERIIDLKLHDIIIHEQIDASDATKVKQNFLCVVERTLTNVKVKIMDTDEVDGANTALSNLTTTGKANISAKGTYNSSATYTSGTVGAAIKGKVNIDGSSIMTGPLKMRAGSMQCAIAPYWDGVGFFKLNSDNSVTLLASMEATDGLCPAANNTYNLGKTNYKWKDLYVSRVITGVLNNGANINVPTVAGTLARVEDIENKITNCITEIPQDIKLGINGSGSLILKSGSKVYIPDGPGVFTPVTMTADHELMAPAADKTSMLVVDSNGNIGWRHLVSECFSGTTAPTAYTNMLWYDTTNNVIKMTSDGGTTWSSTNYSFPVCIATRNTTTCIIDQIFNGFGYIGSAVFALPGITVSIPYGRTSSGLLNSQHYTTTAVSISSESYNETVYNLNIGLGPAGVSLYYYNYFERRNIVSNGSIAIVGNVDFVSGRVVRLYTNYPFRAVDYSDRRFIAHQSMPSRNYIDLTLGASGDTYIAPADGYIAFAKTADGSNQYISLRNIISNQSTNCFITSTGLIGRITIPVSKNDGINVMYTAGGATTTFRFIFANGIK